MSQKLTSAIRVDIPPNGSTVEIPVNEDIEIPEGYCIGKFFIRLCLAKLSLNAPDCKFRAGWKGKTNIVIQNNGPNTVEILKGDELGELDILATVPTEGHILESHQHSHYGSDLNKMADELVRKTTNAQ